MLIPGRFGYTRRDFPRPRRVGFDARRPAFYVKNRAATMSRKSRSKTTPPPAALPPVPTAAQPKRYWLLAAGLALLLVIAGIVHFAVSPKSPPPPSTPTPSPLATAAACLLYTSRCV